MFNDATIEELNSLMETINNTDEKVLSEKLNTYFDNNLEDLNDVIRGLTCAFSWRYSHNVLYTNNLSFWNCMYAFPYDALIVKGTDYKLTDKYVYQDEKRGDIVESCNRPEDFFNPYYIKQLSIKISEDLKNKPEIVIDQITPKAQDILIKILNN